MFYCLSYARIFPTFSKLSLLLFDTHLFFPVVLHHKVNDASPLLPRYTLNGSNTAECLANGMWSLPPPVCRGTWGVVLPPPGGLACFCIHYFALRLFCWLHTAVQCGLAPVPLYGMIVYDKKVQGNQTYYGTEGTYTCLPPYVLMGEPRAACTADGTWTETPQCKRTIVRYKYRGVRLFCRWLVPHWTAVLAVVTCPPPEDVERGFVSGADQKVYGHMETVVYGCDEGFTLDGNLRSVCQRDGKWSEKPSCNGRSLTHCSLAAAATGSLIGWILKLILNCCLSTVSLCSFSR